MATRNRTSAFLKFRNAIRQSKPSIAGGDHVAIEMSGSGEYSQLIRAETYNQDSAGSSSNGSLPPLWVDLSEKIKEDMAKIKGKLAELSKAQARALLPSFDEDEDSSSLLGQDGWGRGKGKGKGGGLRPRTAQERTVELLTTEITKGLKACEKRLHRLTAAEGGRERGGGEQSAAICRNLQRSMATDLQALSLEFRKQSKAYIQRLQQQQQESAVPSILHGRSDANGASSSSSAASSSGAHGGDSYNTGLDERQMLKARKVEQEAVERDAEIQEIVSSVNDLAQIMKDLSVLVIDQGTIVDRIDYNIQNVSDRVDKGTKELQKADATHKKGAMIYCIMLLLVLCLILLVLIVLKHLIF